MYPDKHLLDAVPDLKSSWQYCTLQQSKYVKNSLVLKYTIYNKKDSLPLLLHYRVALSREPGGSLLC